MRAGGRIFWRPSVNRVAAVVMVPRTHNRNSWPEILRYTNCLATVTLPSAIVSRCRVCGTAQNTLFGSRGGHRFRAQRLPSPHEPVLSSNHPPTVWLSGCYCAKTKSWITINLSIACSHRNDISYKSIPLSFHIGYIDIRRQFILHNYDKI